ncbi:hypothetical protein FQN60_010519 [Etheostoma spectabile]|uniref:Uncharacterized protein n=1 Tax=Etheostoma spectabile TaxID=54343 RepID=A0A5J5D721_9PERO|nr:hypothetical protein FQN60_010519 [Etheostoma spectabile]
MVEKGDSHYIQITASHMALKDCSKSTTSLDI